MSSYSGYIDGAGLAWALLKFTRELDESVERIKEDEG